MSHTLYPHSQQILWRYRGIRVYSEIRLSSGIWDRVSISRSQYLNSFTAYENRTSVGAYIFFFLITEQRSPGKIQLSRCRFKMADGTMSGGLEVLNSAAERSDQLRSPSFAPIRQLRPVEKVSGGHKKKKKESPRHRKCKTFTGAQCKSPGRSIYWRKILQFINVKLY